MKFMTASWIIHRYRRETSDMILSSTRRVYNNCNSIILVPIHNTTASRPNETYCSRFVHKNVISLMWRLSIFWFRECFQTRRRSIIVDDYECDESVGQTRGGGAKSTFCALPSARCSTFEVTTKRSETSRAEYYIYYNATRVACGVRCWQMMIYIYFSTFLLSIVKSDEWRQHCQRRQRLYPRRADRITRYDGQDGNIYLIIIILCVWPFRIIIQ